MEKNVVGISIEKIQQVIYQSIHSRIQESQNDDATLRNVIIASEKISQDFYKLVGLESEPRANKFQIKSEELLLKTSGCLIFYSDYSDSEIRKKLKNLYRRYYIEFNGNIEIHYTIKKMEVATDNDKIMAIQNTKKALKQPQTLSAVIEDNQDFLFALCKAENRGKITSKNATFNFKSFVVNINDLKKLDAQNEKYFRIAVIKADFDGMGDLFASITEYKRYREISCILSKTINLVALNNAAGKIKKDPWLFPLYAAGDDLFFAVEIHDVGIAIDLCMSILADINRNLVKNHLSLSVGIEITRNHEPIRYYYERVEEQLQNAKTYVIKKPSKGKKGRNDKINLIRIGLANRVFDFQDHYSEKKSELKKTGEWIDFLKDINKLRDAENQGIKVQAFLYTLLEKITPIDLSPKKTKDQMNQAANLVIYHCIPQNINSRNRNLAFAELEMISIVLYKISSAISKNGKSTQHDFDFQDLNELVNYVRVLLMFMDDRFQENNHADTSIIIDDSAIDRVKRTVFNRGLRYLYENNLSFEFENSVGDKMNLRSYFVNYSQYKIEEESDPVQYYQRLPLSISLFYRMKKNINFEENMELIKDFTNVFAKEQNELKKDASTKAQSLAFDPKVLEISKEAKDQWNENYINSLLIFYQLCEANIQFRVKFSAKKKDLKNKGAN